MSDDDDDGPQVHGGRQRSSARVVDDVPEVDGGHEGASAPAGSSGTEAAPSPQTPVGLKALEFAHKNALIDVDNARQEVERANSAKKDATAKREQAHKAKEDGLAESKAAWKRAIQEENKAKDAWQVAKQRAKEKDEVRKKAWSALQTARQETRDSEEEAHNAAADRLFKNHTTLISAPRQATEGLKPWAGCPRVTVVQLPSAKLPAFDGHEETAIDGSVVKFEPILFGTTVVVAGTGGMKTVRTLDFLQSPVSGKLALESGLNAIINADLPLVMVSCRINLAQKFERDLEKRGIAVRI